MNNTNQPTDIQDDAARQQTSRGRWKLYLVLAICAAPLVLSYVAYYIIKPTGRTNYGTLLDPRDYPMPTLNSVLLGGQPEELTAYKGKWVMLQVSSAGCQKACASGVFNMRQLRLMQGKEMERVERVLLLTDTTPLDTLLLREYDGMHVLQASGKALQAWLPAEAGAGIEDRLYLIDPLGNLMMRYNVDADPMKINKDLIKLLKASSIG